MTTSQRQDHQQGHQGHGQDHQGHGHGHGHVADEDAAAMADLLDLDAEVLHDYLTEVMGWVRGLVGDAPAGRILDVGCGTGTGTFALAQTFAGAGVTAIDASGPFLAHLQQKATERGLSQRVTIVPADLDAFWPAVGPADLAWASASLHHFADPVVVLRHIFQDLRPGGLMVVVEMDDFGRNLPDDVGIGRPGLELRARQAAADRAVGLMPTLGSDWGPRLTDAGFTIEAERVFDIDLTPPLPAATGRYVQGWLQRLRSQTEGLLDDDDLATLDVLIDSDGPLGVLQRGDLTVKAVRHLWIGRRP